VHQEEALQRVALFHSTADLFHQHRLILSAIFVKAVRPIVSGSGNVADELALIEELSELTFEHLVDDALLHVDYDRSGLEVCYVGAYRQVRLRISVAEEGAERVIVLVGFVGL